MSIRELEPRFKLGLIELGKKVGDPVPNHSALLRYYYIIHSNAGESWLARLLYKIPIISFPFAWLTEALHSFRVSTLQPNKARLRGSGQPWCQDCNQQLVGDEINRHPLLGKTLCYVSD